MGDTYSDEFDLFMKDKTISSFHINYDGEHPILICSYVDNYGDLFDEPIDVDFLNEYKDRFKEIFRNIVISDIKDGKKVVIPTFVLNGDVIELIGACNNLEVNLVDITGDGIIEFYVSKLRKLDLDIKINGEKFKDKYILQNYSMETLSCNVRFFLSANLSSEEISNFRFINKDAIIRVSSSDGFSSLGYDERKYIEKLTNIFSQLQKHDRSYNIIISVSNRELLVRSSLFDFSNINLTIEIDGVFYSKSEFLGEDKKLEGLVKEIKEADLSSYEKFLAVYNIVKKFRAYKEENDRNFSKARELKYVLEDDNDCIVCVGFSNLLTALLDKVGISSYTTSLQVDTSYDDGFTMEDKPTDLVGHMRNLIKLDDDKYNIHGIFVVDATWDNNMKLDLYNNSLMTFDRKKESYSLESLEDEDLLLDFHDFSDFSDKVNFCLGRKIRNNSFLTGYNDKVVWAFRVIYNKILSILVKLDYEKCCYFYDKYDNLIEEKQKGYKKGDVKLRDVELIFTEFLNEYALYIIPLSNKSVSDDVFMKALYNIKIKLDGYSEEEALEYARDVLIVNEKKGREGFPYVYDPNNLVPNYLETVKKGK